MRLVTHFLVRERPVERQITLYLLFELSVYMCDLYRV